MESLDTYDLKLLAELQHDGTLSAEVLAERVGLSKTPCWRRVNRLKQRRVIEQTVSLVNAQAVGIETTVFVHIRVEKHDSELFKRVDQALRALPEVMEAYLMMGEADYLIRVAVPNVAAFERFMTERLHRIPGIRETRSSPALRPVKYTTELPLPSGARNHGAAPRRATRRRD